MFRQTSTGNEFIVIIFILYKPAEWHTFVVYNFPDHLIHKLCKQPTLFVNLVRTNILLA